MGQRMGQQRSERGRRRAGSEFAKARTATGRGMSSELVINVPLRASGTSGRRAMLRAWRRYAYFSLRLLSRRFRR